MLCICPRINDHHYYTHQSNGWSVLQCICVVYFTTMLAAPRAGTVYNFGIMIAHLHVFVVISVCGSCKRALLLNFSYAISNYTRGEYIYIYSTLSIDAIIHTEPTHHHNTQSITNQSRKAR